MAAVTQHDLIERLESAKYKAQLMQKEILVSHRLQVDNVDPLIVFANSNHLYKGQRSFWSDASGELTLVGIGEARKFDVDGDERFAEIREQWGSLIQTQLEDFTTPYKYGTGPMIMGGFSFDTKKFKTPLWTNYADASFVLPVHLYSFFNDQAFLTTNMFVKPDSDIHALFEKAMKARAQILKKSTIPSGLDQSFTLTEIDPEQWKESVADTTAMINKGKIEKVVLAREVIAQADDDISAIVTLSNLLEQQPNSFVFAFERGHKCFLGASPERLVQKQNSEVLSTCLAGSIKRGDFHTEDERLGEQLLNDQKNLEEHAFVVQMIRDALEEIAGTVHIPDGPTLYKGRDIQHLFTPVIVKQASNIPLMDVVERLHPTPALGGFPQAESVEMIRENEKLDRGWYSSPIGWVDLKDQGEFAVAIRSGLINENHVSLFAGCGIVADSNPESEYEETLIKLKPMLSALGGSFE
ncbi:isochorismate synthase [Pseudalkalibacillus berkeleyi]|uniref:Isochorismate synthase MenF n=1 Tax=Pseudalkalibacillus berkeleyi TaxID=1069813 RepID=A0ABS9H073_9BACL|nr:isochorismate synthase [Pseudalkalibacillus berkeleyi]MCF6138394.1 isochorismate synthase [Pseudalkalibacillus berkeleyi]